MPDIVKQISIKNPQASGQYETKDIGANAENVSYTNTSTSIDAINVQDALTELDDELESLSSVVNGKSTVTAVSGQTTSNTIEQIQINDNIYNIPSGTTVVANPTMAGTEGDLTSIQIGSTKYNNPVGSTVVANPTGTSGNNLTRIKIDGVDYNISGGSAASDLDDLDNVDITTPTDGQVLKYDSANQKWVNANEDSGSTVTWNQITQTGTKIATVNIDGTATDVYAPTSGGGGTSSLAGLDDVTIASASNDQDLSYDSTSSKWINKTHRVELTKAQYDTLPSSKLTDGIEYFITDMETTGTEIVANPQETATGGVLTKLQIGDEIYSVGGSSALWKDITGTLTAGQTSITLTDSSILESSTFDFYTNKFGVNPTDVELVNSTYNFTEFMNGKIVVREHKIDTTDKKLFIVGLTKDSNAISITDTDLLTYLNDITSGYLKGCSSYDTNDSTTQTGILAIGDWGNGLVINTFIVGWTEYKSGTFYGVIDLNEAPVTASGTPQYQQNTYSDPYDVSSGYSLILTFDEQSTDLGVKVRVTNEIS